MYLFRCNRKRSLSLLLVSLAIFCLWHVSSAALSLPSSISGNGLTAIATAEDGPPAPSDFHPAEAADTDPNGTEVAARLAAGLYHSAMINYDGTVFMWGDNSYGQAGLDQIDYSDYPIRLQLDRSAVDISLGSYHSLILTDDGKVYSFGRNIFGQLGNQSIESTNLPAVVEDLPAIIAISAGALHSMALAEDGSVWAWGNNSDLQVGSVPDQVIEDSSGNIVGRRCLSPVKIIESGAVAISAGGSHSLYLDHDGQVYAWGANERGQLGNGTTQTSGQPAPVTGLNNVTMISAGYQHNLALIRQDDEQDQIWSWGDDSFGQSGLSSDFSQSPFRTLPAAIYFPLQRDDGPNWSVISIVAGMTHSAAILGYETAGDLTLPTKHQLLLWGSNSHGQLAQDGAAEILPRPIRLNIQFNGHTNDSFAAFDDLALGGYHTLLLSSRGLLAASGRGDAGQLGTYSVVNRFSFTAVEIPDVFYPAFREGSQMAAMWESNDHLVLRWPAAQDNAQSEIGYSVLIRHPDQDYQQWDVGSKQSLALNSFLNDQPLEIILTAYDLARQGSEWSELSRLVLYYIPREAGEILPDELFKPTLLTVYNSTPYPHNWQPEPDILVQQLNIPWSAPFLDLGKIRPAADWQAFIIAVIITIILLLICLIDIGLRVLKIKTAGEQNAGTDQ